MSNQPLVFFFKGSNQPLVINLQVDWIKSSA